MLVQLRYTVPYVLLPGVLYFFLDTVGWRSLNPQIFPPPPLTASFSIHVASEAIVKSIPFGVPFSDSVRSLLLKKEHGIPVSSGVSSAISRRLHLGISQGIFLMMGGLVSFVILQEGSIGILGRQGLEWVPLCTGTILVIASFGVLTIASSSKAKVVLEQLTILLPWVRARGRLVIWIRSSRMILNRASGITIAWFFLYWCVELIETYVFVILLGIPASPLQVIAVEMIVSTLKLAGFFLPSGIGVQDVGYASMFSSLGCIAHATDAGGFVLLKRAKDIFWIGTGYVMLTVKGIRPFRRPKAAEAS